MFPAEPASGKKGLALQTTAMAWGERERVPRRPFWNFVHFKCR